jgi:hypothetical protein
MRSAYRVLFATILLIGLLAGSGAYGQGGATGAISRSVVDTSGRSVAGEEVARMYLHDITAKLYGEMK